MPSIRTRPWPDGRLQGEAKPLSSSIPVRPGPVASRSREATGKGVVPRVGGSESGEPPARPGGGEGGYAALSLAFSMLAS